MPTDRVDARDIGRGLLALAAVTGIYGLMPWIGVVVGFVQPSFDLPTSYEDVQAPREAVFWEPPAPPSPPAAEVEEPADPSPSPSEEPAGEPDPTPPEEPASAGELDDAPVLATAGVPDRRKALRERARARRAAKAAEAAAAPPPPPPRELTAKEQREEDRDDRKDARRAERKQCAELVDQIVQVAEDEWWFGRELVSCYRTHLEQFDMIGGAAWAEDDKGKKIGVKVFVSKTVRGDPGRAAGFKSGDIIQSVNGMRMAGWGGVALVSTQLLRGHVKVKRLRKGVEQIVHLRVVDPDELAEAREAQQAVVEVETIPGR